MALDEGLDAWTVRINQLVIEFIEDQVRCIDFENGDIKRAEEQVTCLIHYIAFRVGRTVDRVRWGLMFLSRDTAERAYTLMCYAQRYKGPVLWHIPQGSVYGDGFCYLAVVKEQYHNDARLLLGAYPTLYALSQLHMTWFNDDVYTLSMVTDDEDRPVPALKAVSVFQAMRGVAHNATYAITGSCCDVLVDIGPATYVVPEVPIYDTVGGSAVTWHVTTDNEKFSSSFPNGYCYEHLFKYKYRYTVACELGSLPDVRTILSLDRTLFRPKHSLDRVLFVRNTSDGRPDAFTAHDVLTTLAHDVVDPPVGSLGWFMVQRWKKRNLVKVDPPSLDDLLGTATKLRASAFDMNQARVDAYVPPVSGEVAQRVFDNAMCDWQLPTDDDAVVEDVLTSMAEVLVSGSADEVFRNATVECHGRVLALERVVHHAVVAIGATNSLRLWVRSFRKGEMCLRISGLLSDERNVTLRQAAAARYFSGMRYVHLCFDTVCTYRRISSIRYVERVFIRVAKSIRMTNVPMSEGLACWLTNDDTVPEM